MPNFKRVMIILLTAAFAFGLLSACEESGRDVSDDKSSLAESLDESSEEPLDESSGETSGGEVVRDWPYINGSFIQYGAFFNYNDAQLTAHFDYLEEAGIEYLVLFTSAQLTDDAKFSTLYYPSEYAADRKAAGCDTSHTDITEKMLDQCRSHGMKAYITPINMDGWGVKWGLTNKSMIDGFVADTLAVSREMYDLYKAEYGETFYGWYFAPEFNNYFSFWTNSHYTSASDALNAILEGYTALDPDMPFLMSPYFCDFAPYSNAVDTAAAWDKIFSGINFRKGDIFCPQDCVGSGLANINDFTDYYAEFKKVVDKHENLAFWGNPEDFVQANWSSAPITRYVLQLEKASQYVEGFISFAYSHYYAPDICGTARFHDDYVNYYNTGVVEYYGENLAPVPVSLTCAVGSTGIKLEAVFDNCKYGIARVEFYRGDELATTIFPAKDAYGEATKTFSATDNSVPENIEYTYTAKAYAFSGETAVTEAVTIKAAVPECVSIGKAYTTDYSGNPGYPDDGKKLTDGKYAAAAVYSDLAASGFADCSDVAFIIDLETETKVALVIARALNSGSGGAIISTSVRVSFSTDGVTYTEPVSQDGPSCPEEAGWSVAEFAISDVSARYVKVKYMGLRNWLFIDEISVYSAN